jgi:hypothetical protein
MQDPKLSIKPTKFNPSDIDTKHIAHAGHLTEIGEKILTLGCKNAKHVTTMDWGLGAQTNSTNENKPTEKKTHFLMIRP